MSGYQRVIVHLTFGFGLQKIYLVVTLRPEFKFHDLSPLLLIRSLSTISQTN